MDNTAGAVDVPLDLFGGLNTELAGPGLPEGLSPDCQDVAFVPGSVASRECLKAIMPPLPNNVTVVWFRSYVQPNGETLNLLLDSSGTLWKEDLSASPSVFSQIGEVAAGSTAISTTAFGREYIAISDGIIGSDIPRQYDGTNFDRVSQDGPGLGPGTVADSVTAGNISAGQHQVCVLFLTRQGYITAPSAPKAWTAMGGFKVALTDIPIGPSNVIARIIAFTGAGGDNFFYIPVDLTLPVAISSTVINDNTTTTLDLDFTDNALFAATAIDIDGNNLFAQVVLGPCLGFLSYDSRLFAWGERNKVQNLLNMGFDGGYYASAVNTPLGWTPSGTAGVLTQGEFGLGYQMSSGAILSQPAQLDAYGAQILKPLTKYRFRCRIQPNSVTVAGNLTVRLAGTALACTAVLAVPSATAFVEAVFDVQTPRVIPADATLQLTATLGGVTDSILLDECELIYDEQPYTNTIFRTSYVNNPEAFDGVTGVLGSADDPSPIRMAKIIRNTLFFLTADRLQETVSQVAEPSQWTVSEVATECGALSAIGVDSGEEWMVWASRSGLRIFDGGQPYKISQEIQPDWDTINWSNQQFIWVANDSVTRRIYVGLPTFTAGTPDIMLVLDYRELDTAGQVAGADSVRATFAGSMVAMELARKWTRWNLKLNRAAVLNRSVGSTMCFGAGNGQTLGSGNGFGRVYQLDAAKYTDDDYGQMFPYYTTYFMVNSDKESMLKLGSHRKLFQYISAYVTGIGNFLIMPYAESLSNPWPTPPVYQLGQGTTLDLEWGLNVTTTRCAFRLSVSPLPDTTDVQFNLQRLVVSMKMDTMSPLGGRV